MSGLFASLSIGNAREKISSFLRGFSAAPPSLSSARQEDDLEELRKMERTMRRIRAMLHDADEHWNIREESAKLRLKELKEVAYNMEDVVDEYEYEVNRYKLEVVERMASAKSARKRKRQEENEECSMDTDAVHVPKDLVLQARKITKRFDEIMRHSEYLRLSENEGERRFVPDISSFRQTSSIVIEKSILGRDQEKETLVEELLSRERENVASSVSVMAIVGMGGVGKTTLAQLVYNDPRVKQSFEKLAWVCVSENFQVNKITRNAITSLTNEECKYTELADLQWKLANELKEKRVLLVLDDVWNDRQDGWDLLCRPMSAAIFCQIIVTTRSRKVATVTQAVACHPLHCLNPDESWKLFSLAAFTAAKESDIPTNLVRIGKSIIEKCNGLPLAIKTIGSMLRYKTDEREWEDVLENELWNTEQTRNEVLPALELSFKHMPVYLKQCFISLSLFPKDYFFGVRELLQIWQQLDMVDLCDGNKRELGEKYFTELVERSMIQYSRSVKKEDENEDLYLMHDLMHDLASFLAREDFYRLDGNASHQIPRNVRYLSINGLFFTVPSVGISRFPPSLRVIVVIGKGIPGFMRNTVTEITLPESLFSNCKKLRTLGIGTRSLIMALPACMGNLKLLSQLSYHDIHLGPSTLHFQNLVLNGIGHLVNLHILPVINITRSPCRFNIKWLRNINKIGELSINGLNNISCIEDAKEAQLKRKENLRSLRLDFYGIIYECPCGRQPQTVTVPHDQLLDSLRPHCNLRELIVENYYSGRYPSWLGNPSFSKLTSIQFGPGSSKHLPVLCGLPSLKKLHIIDMDSVEHVAHEFSCKGFPSLTVLIFEEMSKWSGWSRVDAGEFPSLNTLTLSRCPKLRSLPLGLLGSLKSLILDECDSFAIFAEPPALHEVRIEECTGPNELPICQSFLTWNILPKLTTLKLRNCLNISAVHYLPSLTTLTIKNCPNISFVDYPPSLTTLRIHGSIDETVLYGLLNIPSLKSLKIAHNDTVMCLPLKQQSLPSLTRLKLISCTNLQRCDGFTSLTSLKYFEVTGCCNLPIDDLLEPPSRWSASTTTKNPYR